MSHPHIPYENGQLLKDNLTFALVPRILNANKGVKDDKVKVEKYTNFNFGLNSISSFSLGHYCEAYIDWGPIGMMIHLLIYGLVGGWLWHRVKKRYSHDQSIALHWHPLGSSFAMGYNATRFHHGCGKNHLGSGMPFVLVFNSLSAVESVYDGP